MRARVCLVVVSYGVFFCTLLGISESSKLKQLFGDEWDLYAALLFRLGIDL